MKGLSGCLVVAILMFCAGCSSSPPPLAATTPSSTVDPRPQSQPAASQPDVFVAMGPIVVEQQLDVTALRDGVVTELAADVDAMVKKGQLLARLDDRELVAARDASEHKLRSIEADVKNWESEVKMREVDLHRTEELQKAGVETQQQVDHERYNLEATSHELDRERENLLNARANVQGFDLELEKTRDYRAFRWRDCAALRAAGTTRR